MFELPDIISKKFGPLVTPFERRNAIKGEFKSPLKFETDFLSNYVHNVSLLGSPDNLILTSRTNPDKKLTYLWVIDDAGLKIIFEDTNSSAERGCACHTNITGGDKAYHGGEMWFFSDYDVLINHNSGRYNHGSEDQKTAVVEYFKHIGFTVFVE